ncbi:Hpt domain-containing protein [Ottowia sp.]|uniref:Hpt domain-containing protein n=1 Tax=Ottowia sp. TaxID=1898956 RepID=UPI003A8972F6
MRSEVDDRVSTAGEVADLGPLAWVLDETRESIASATKALKRYLREAEAARGIDMASVDASQLRLARQQIHQAVGALEMVGQSVAAHMVRAMEEAVHRFVQHPDGFDGSAALTVERTGFALMEYLQGQLGAHPRSALGLFPQFREIQQMAGADRIHPADLWTHQWGWLEPQWPSSSVQALKYGPEVRAQIDHRILRIMKRGSVNAAAELVPLCLGLAAEEPEKSRPRIFWILVAGLFEALGQSLVPMDVYTKRATSRILLQYTAMAHGDKAVSERLSLDVLFFCAQAVPPQGDAAPVLQAVRSAWGLQSHQPVDYEQSMFGMFDPALLAQGRKRVEAIKENWSALAGGDVGRLKACTNQLGLVAESLDKLHPKGQPLSAALRRVAEQLLQTGQAPSAELAMETATAVLFLEASFADFHPADQQFGARIEQLAARLDNVRSGASAPALESWMEELYRQISDQQTMGTVVAELRTTLGEVEQRLDQFFRHPEDGSVLASVPERMSQMRGVLSVLALDQAALAMSRLSETVAEWLADDLDVESLRQSNAFNRLGNSLGALGFQIDMMGYQPMLARKLFVYDEAQGELKYVMGRVSAAPSTSKVEKTVTGEQAVLTDLELDLSGPRDPSAQADVAGRLSQIAKQAALDDKPALAQAANRAATAAGQPDADGLSDALADLQTVVNKGKNEPVPEPAISGAPEEALDGEDELLDIFLDEAREVVQVGRQALMALGSAPGDMEQQTTLRRAFHTLKGSSRMVGLDEFGEAAWAMEQLLNAWLAEQKPINDDVRTLSSEAIDGFARWVEDIATPRASRWKAEPFCAAADALRLQGQRRPLDLPQQAGAADAASDVTLDATPAAPEPALPPAPVESLEVEIFEDLDASDAPTLLGAEVSSEAEDTDASLADMAIDFELPDLELEAFAEVEGAGDVPAPANLLADEALSLPVNVLADAGRVEPPESAEQASLPEVKMLDLDLSELGFDVGDEGVATAIDAVELTAPTVPGSDDAFDLPEGNAIVVESGAEAADVLDESLPTSELAETLDGATNEQDNDDSYKEIGDLRISMPLYNVYLNEADEWSRQLMTDLSEWALELNRPVPHRAIARAHSLAGSSATVGFTALSDLARAIEHALERLTAQSHGSIEQAQVLGDAAADVRRVLHQFAAGILKLPNEDILHAVQALEPVEGQAHSSAAKALDAAHAVHVPPHASVQTASAAPRLVLGDGIDVVDAVDPDLFPIFEEEAEELLPSISASLRQWAKQPDDMAARAEVLRGLHTLKGSARLAGALRLGEMAHRAESAIEVIGVEKIATEDVEPLLDHLDELEEDFRKLQAGGEGVATVGVEQSASDAASSAHAQAKERPIEAAPVEMVPVAETAHAPSVDKAVAQPAQPVVRGNVAEPAALSLVSARASAGHAVRVRSQLLDRMMDQAGEVMTSRARLETQVGQLRGSLNELTGNLERLRTQLRDVELQAETQMQSRMALTKDAQQNFDPLEFDRFTRMQELTRMMAESVNDVATVQRNLQRAVQASEDGLAAQARQSRELQRDLLRTRMVEFDGISERLYRVVRQASKETGKQVRLDVVGGTIEMDRGILERMTPAFEHLLRNCVVHGIEAPAARASAGKDQNGLITVSVQQAGNVVSVAFRDDGAGLDLARIRERAIEKEVIAADQKLSDGELSNLIFAPGFTTTTEVTELAGRGVGMDVVRTEVLALGGRIETETSAGQGTLFRLVLPLTTAVTHVVMVRAGQLSIGVPSNQVEVVRRLTPEQLSAAYASGTYRYGDEDIAFYWSGALLQSSARSVEPPTRSTPVVVFRSADQRVAMHVDEVLGNQEVVVKPLGPQLSRLPGLVAMTALASGAVALIYNPVALAAVFGERARALSAEAAHAEGLGQTVADDGRGGVSAIRPHSHIPLVLVVDDSITVRRVTQRLLQREGYRVALAADGLQGLEQLKAERPAVVLSDIEMPRMDGFDFVRNIRADEQLRDLPVIMITSRIAEKHREHARELGVEHYLGKPYAEDALLGLVRSFAQAATAAAADAE